MKKNNELEMVTVTLKPGYKFISDKVVDNVDAAIDVLKDAFGNMPKEYFCVLNVNTNGNPINANITSIGNVCSTIVDPRDVFQAAILSNATAIIAMHNHPSGSLRPSKEDIETTKRLIDAGNLIGIRVLDHIIISGDKYLSIFHDQNLKTDKKYNNTVKDILGENSKRHLEEKYYIGQQIKLEHMEGEPQMRAGLKGKITKIDDFGQIHVNWENGSQLALNVDLDSFEAMSELNLSFVGKLQYLGFNGEISEEILFNTEKELIEEIRKMDKYGEKASLIIYEDSNGNTIDLSFLRTIETAINDVSIVPEKEVFYSADDEIEL